MKRGTRCVVEATVVSTDMRGLRLAAGLTVHCGGVRLHVDAPPPGASIQVSEVAALDPGSAGYVLAYADEHMIVDTRDGVVSVTSDDAAGVVALVVAGESRPARNADAGSAIATAARYPVAMGSSPALRAPDRPTSAARAYRWIVGWLRLLVRLFFREVEVTGVEDVPLSRGGVLVSWHPNGLVDPGLILTHFPQQVVFGARHGLFRWPLLGTLLRSVGTVPIYRASDVRRGPASDDARRAANRQTLDALAGAVAQGRFAALFPEGVSHDAPHLMELKTGAARLYYRARRSRGAGAETPVIVPVGLHYDQKRLFRSRALVWFHPPIALPPELDVTPEGDDEDDAGRERARRLTDEIERVLHDVVHATEDWEINDLIHRGRKLVRAERAHRAGSTPHKPRIGEVALGFARVRAGYYARLRSNPERVREVRARVAAYDEDLRALGIEDHELDRPPSLISSRLFTLLLLQVLLVFVLVPPVLLFGYLVNGPTALLIIGLSRVGARLEKDEATIKLLGGAVLFPLTWLGAAVGTAALHARLALAYPSLPANPVLAAWLAAVVAAIGGAVALRYLHVAAETARAVRVRLTRIRRAKAIDRLRDERSAIHDELMEISAGLELPGTVADDGSVTSARDRTAAR